ncbi:hypothetical protein GIB67_024105 [Kingdonia uniflora]|uniref:Tail specific protease domain-containing protein n=1 Tax=Kingdonia uniflora TaxID=39325 RepID=A0A7J7MMF5_9MAGN|nr:hypothetical protein GIB67_024105 [Kingdonia uniflora]
MDEITNKGSSRLNLQVIEGARRLSELLKGAYGGKSPPYYGGSPFLYIDDRKGDITIEQLNCKYILLYRCLVPESVYQSLSAELSVFHLLLSCVEAEVTYTVGRDPQYQKNIVAETAPLVTAPVIVLVNNKTASASEIVATALHDNCRAVLVGERTYGKGLIQSVFELHDGSGVVVTVGKYVTPRNMDINGNGIEPDFRSFPDWGEVTKHLSQCHMPSNG